MVVSKAYSIALEIIDQVVLSKDWLNVIFMADGVLCPLSNEMFGLLVSRTKHLFDAIQLDYKLQFPGISSISASYVTAIHQAYVFVKRIKSSHGKRNSSQLRIFIYVLLHVYLFQSTFLVTCKIPTEFKSCICKLLSIKINFPHRRVGIHFALARRDIHCMFPYWTSFGLIAYMSVTWIRRRSHRGTRHALPTCTSCLDRSRLKCRPLGSGSQQDDHQRWSIGRGC